MESTRYAAKAAESLGVGTMTDPLLEVWKDGRTYAMTPTILVDELSYQNYRHNRQRCPELAPEKYYCVFKNWEELEKRYQQELKP